MPSPPAFVSEGESADQPVLYIALKLRPDHAAVRRRRIRRDNDRTKRFNGGAAFVAGSGTRPEFFGAGCPLDPRGGKPPPGSC